MKKKELNTFRENYTDFTGAVLSEGLALAVHFDEKDDIKIDTDFHSKQMTCKTFYQKWRSFKAAKWNGTNLWPSDLSDGTQKYLEGVY